MKMKSKFFGLNAKLALAVLAVGTMFTSCYDSENGDVTQPYQAPDAVYSFTGTVTNDITGTGVKGATVTFSGAISGSTTTDELGTYQFTTTVRDGVEGTVTLTVTGDDFEDTEATVAVDKIANGQSIIYFKNVLVNYTAYLPDGVEIDTSNSTTTDDSTLQGENKEGENYVAELDIINKSDSPITVEYVFQEKRGSRITEDADDIMGNGVITRLIPDGAKADIREWIIADLGGVTPGTDFDTFTTEPPISFVIPAGQALKGITVSYTYEYKTYNYSYGEDSGRVIIQRVDNVRYNSTTVTTDYYHGHGHGHGNGDNAGGGIIVPEL